jgi:hypothetical protein
MSISLSRYEISIIIGSYDLFWLRRDEFVLCKGMDTLAYWRRIDGRWVDCKGY